MPGMMKYQDVSFASLSLAEKVPNDKERKKEKRDFKTGSASFILMIALGDVDINTRDPTHWSCQCSMATLEFSDREFASVTLCHLNAWKRDESALANPKMKALRDRNSTELLHKVLTRIHADHGSRHAYTYEDLVISCTYNAKSCNTTDFREFYDPSHGICQTFNFDGNKTSSRAGPLYGLRMVIRTDQAKYLPTKYRSRMCFGYFRLLRTATSLGVRFISTTRLPEPHGTCTRQKTVNGKHYSGNYDVESCFRNCLQERIVADCECYDPAYQHADDGGATPSCADGNQTKN
ncbi:Amiloride-sensitive sodium channel, partial [Ostertagia ostertagi]